MQKHRQTNKQKRLAGRALNVTDNTGLFSQWQLIMNFQYLCAICLILLALLVLAYMLIFIIYCTLQSVLYSEFEICPQIA